MMGADGIFCLPFLVSQAYSMYNYQIGSTLSRWTGCLRAASVAFALVLVLFAEFSNSQSSPNVFSERLRISFSDSSELIRIAKFNTDGTKLLLVGSKIAEVYSTESGKKLAAFEGDTDYLKEGEEFHWQPGGSHILHFGRKFSNRAVARIWDADSGKLIAVLDEVDGVRVAEWNAPGDRILTVGGAETKFSSSKIAYSIRDKSGKTIRAERLPLGQMRYLGFSSSGKKLIGNFFYKEGTKPIRIMDIDSGKVEKGFDHNLANTSSPVYASFAGESPNRKFMCGHIVSSVGVTCWRADDDSKPLYSFIDTKETGNIQFVGFSPDSKSIAILLPKPRMIKILDVETGRESHSLESPDELKRGFGDRWSPDGKYFVINDLSNEVSVWNLNTEKVAWKRKTTWLSRYHPDFPDINVAIDYEVFRFNQANGLLLSVSGENVRVFDPAGGTVLFEAGKKDPKRQERSFRRRIANWSPDWRTLLTIDESNRSVILWAMIK